jgi:hypothetical protein
MAIDLLPKALAFRFSLTVLGRLALETLKACSRSHEMPPFNNAVFIVAIGAK